MISPEDRAKEVIKRVKEARNADTCKAMMWRWEDLEELLTAVIRDHQQDMVKAVIELKGDIKAALQEDTPPPKTTDKQRPASGLPWGETCEES